MQIHFNSNEFCKLPTNNKIKKIKNSTKCAKMTEEGETIRNGINGVANIHSFSNYSRTQIDGSQILSNSNELHDNNSSSLVHTLPNPKHQQQQQHITNGPLGGRLQFFKDGKFILELARSREGEKTGWVSVPRKTFWPPTASLLNSTNNANNNHHKNESSTSLSFSDDNSSVQSSPWQRDHCWKQTTPRRNVSMEMAMYYCRPMGKKYSQNFYKTARIKRRRPYDAKQIVESIEIMDNNKLNGQTDDNISNIDIGPEQIDGKVIKKEVDSDNIDASDKTDTTNLNDTFDDDDTIKDDCIDKSNTKQNDDKINSKNKQKSEHVVNKHNKNCNKKLINRQKLTVVLQKLIDRIPEAIVMLSVSGTPGVNNHITTNNPRIDMLHHNQQQHVSPRKRILREFEKVSLDDLTTMKRSRAKGNNHHHSLSAHNSTIGTAGGTTAVVATTATIGGGSSSSNNSSGSGSQPNTYPFVNQSSKAINGNHSENSVLPPPPVAAQATSRPISSYSITSLLSHNNSNNSKPSSLSDTRDIIMNEISVSSQRTTMLASPKSPQSISHASTQHRSSAFSSKKRSPSSYGTGGNNTAASNNSSRMSPNMSTQQQSTLNHYNRTPTLHSPINYGRNRSPDLSPSPEQIYTRYRQTHSGMSSYNSSPSSSSGFHPYLSSASSRGSPSTGGALSPPAAAESLRYRSLLPPGSPSQQQTYSTTISSAQSLSSPSSFSRYSPSVYSQVSPQHYSSKNTTASNFNMNNLISNNSSSNCSNSPYNGKSSSRDVSPGTRTGVSESSRENCVGTRTLPKKTAALRQQPYDVIPVISSPTSCTLTTVADSAIRHSSSINDNFYKSQSTQSTSLSDQCRKTNDGNTGVSLNLSRPHSPPELNSSNNCCTTNSTANNINKYEKDYHRLIANSNNGGGGGGNSNSTNNHSLSAGFDSIEANSNVIRPSLIPSLQHSHPSMYYMYAPHTVAPSGAYLPPGYYHSMGYASAAAAAAAAVYRNPLWMHYPASAATIQPSRLLAYGAAAAASLAGPPSAVTSAHNPWGTMAPPHHALIADDPVSLVRIKDEPSSDVPLNLSKH